MITKMHIENFKCFRDFDIDLGPFNVLIGPNDSGKTAFLQAVGIASSIAEKHFEQIGSLEVDWGISNETPIVWKGDNSARVVIEIQAINKRKGGEPSPVIIELAKDNSGNLAFWTKPRNPMTPSVAHPQTAERVDPELVGRAGYYRLNPADLRAQSPISAKPLRDGSILQFQMSKTGSGFPTFLEDLLRRDHRAFAQMEREFNIRFPSYQVQVTKQQRGMNALDFRVGDSRVLPCQNVSDGAILYLAFLAITHQPEPPAILLIEEPENGVHHASLKDIVAMLKDLSEKKGVQVILTTHSPFLLDLVEPEEVRVFAKNHEGEVTAKRLSDFPDVEGMKKHFMTGEIWTMLGQVQKI